MTKTPEHEDLNTSLIAVAGVVGALVVFLMILALQAWYYNVEQAEMYRKAVAPAAEELSRLTTAQQAQLNSYRMIDPSREIVAIPIDRAMALVVRDLAAGRDPLPIPTSQPTTAPATQPVSAAPRPEGTSHE